MDTTNRTIAGPSVLHWRPWADHNRHIRDEHIDLAARLDLIQGLGTIDGLLSTGRRYRDAGERSQGRM